MLDSKNFWDKKHLDYAIKDWINKPTIFAEFAVKYFPKAGALLDLGAGQGQDSMYFAKIGYKVTATDFSDNALKLLKDKIKIEKLAVKVGNVDLSKNLPYKNESFDIVYSHLALHYFDNKTTQRLFGEIYRILKNRGILAVLLNTMDDPEILESEKVEEGLYKSKGIFKRYFTVAYLKELTKGKFEPLILDNKGETYKDEIKTLIRFIGKKI